jgi:hypothetical protein
MGTLHEDVYIYDNISLKSSLERELFQTKVVEKIKTYVLCSIFFLRKKVGFVR